MGKSKKFFTAAILGAAILLAHDLALGKPAAVAPGHLLVAIRPGKSAKGDLPKWQKACNELATKFLIEQGPWGYGIANGFSCRLNKKIIANSGMDQRPTWILQILKQKAGWKLALFYAGQRQPETTTKFPGALDLGEALAVPTAAANAALQLMDGLPVSRYVPSTSEGFAIEDKYEVGVKPPEQFVIFSLTYEPNTQSFIPRQVGGAKFQSSQKQIYKYELKLEENLGSGKHYWAQSTAGRGQNYNSLEANFNSTLKGKGLLSQAFLETLAQGYAGIRVGFPLMRSDPLLSKSYLVSVLVEARGGPLEGLRWYWDFAPAAKAKKDGHDLSFEWSRPSLGWSIGINPGNFISKIDVVPKIGLMDLDATVGIPKASDPDSITPARFRLKNALNLGIESGIETASPWFLVRLWGAYDFSGLAKTAGSSGRVKSLRGGVDTYLDVTKIQDFKFTLLLFALGESMTLEKDSQIVEEANKEFDGISYSLGFIGAGAILSW